MGKHLSRIANLDLQVSRESWVFRFIFWVSGFSLGCLDSVFLPVSAGCLDSLLCWVSGFTSGFSLFCPGTPNFSRAGY
jgi:hypothetical protein